MRLHNRYFALGGSFVTALSVLLIFNSVFAADLLSIQPTKHDCGVVDEGVPATMQATVENISDKEVHVSSVKAN